MGLRALAVLGASEKARPVWDKLLEFEMAVASDRDMARSVAERGTGSGVARRRRGEVRQPRSPTCVVDLADW